MAFYQKYRPKTFSDLIGEDHISKTLLEAIKSDKLSHAYLLTGPRGTGKTTTARLIAKALNCLALEGQRSANEAVSGEPCNDCDFCNDIAAGRAVDIIEIDAASHTKVDEIREIIDNSSIAPTRAKKKVYIIDEVHMLSNSSFNALLKTLEEPPKHVVFILATTEVHKLPATILSRTQRYDFKRISKEDIVKNLKKIASAEKIKIEDEALNLIAICAEGVHRDAVGLLEQIAAVSHDIKKEDVQNILGIAETKEIFLFLEAIFNANPEEGLKIAHGLYADGIELVQFNKKVIEVLRKILLTKLAKKPLFDDTDINLKSIVELAGKIDQKKLVSIIEIFIASGQFLKESPEPLLPIEMAVVESCDSTTNSKFEAPNPKQIQNQKSEIKNEISSKDSSARPKGSPSGVGMTEGRAVGVADPSQGTIKGEAKEMSIEDGGPDADGVIKDDNKTNQPINQSTNQPPVGDTVPVAVFEMAADVWKRIINKIKEENSTLAALLRDAKPLEVSDQKIVLGVQFKFHKDKISEPKNCKLIEGAVSEIMGKKSCTVSCKVADLRVKAGGTFKNDEELLEAAEEIFS